MKLRAGLYEVLAARDGVRDILGNWGIGKLENYDSTKFGNPDKIHNSNS